MFIYIHSYICNYCKFMKNFVLFITVPIAPRTVSCTQEMLNKYMI